MITEITLRFLMTDPLIVLYFSEIWVWNTDTPITILYCNNTKFCAATCVEQYLAWLQRRTSCSTVILSLNPFVPAHRHPVPLSWFRFPVAISPSLVSVDNCRQQWYVRKCRGNSSLYFLNSSVPHRIENEPMLICTLGSCRSADVKQNSSAVKCPIPTGGASPASAACHCCATATKSSAQPSGPLPTNGACYA